jgi:hypothetical protein
MAYTVVESKIVKHQTKALGSRTGAVVSSFSSGFGLAYPSSNVTLLAFVDLEAV